MNSHMVILLANLHNIANIYYSQIHIYALTNLIIKRGDHLFQMHFAPQMI